MKFIEYLRKKLKAHEASNDELLEGLKKLETGKVQRLFDDWSDINPKEHANFLKSSAEIILQRLDNQPAGTDAVLEAYQAIGSVGSDPTSSHDKYKTKDDKYKAFSALQKIDNLLLESKEWQEFWKGRITPADKKMQKNLLLAHRFSLLQSMYTDSLTRHPEQFSKLSGIVKNVEKMNLEFQSYINTPASLVENLEKHIQKERKSTIFSRAKITSDPEKKKEIATNLKKMLQEGRGNTEKLQDLKVQYKRSLGLAGKKGDLSGYLKQAKEYYKTQSKIKESQPKPDHDDRPRLGG